MTQSVKPVISQDPAAGKQVVEENCIDCHDLSRLLEKGMAFQAWFENVQRLAAKKPEHLTEGYIQINIGFLTAKGAEPKLS